MMFSHHTAHRSPHNKQPFRFAENKHLVEAINVKGCRGRTGVAKSFCCLKHITVKLVNYLEDEGLGVRSEMLYRLPQG